MKLVRCITPALTFLALGVVPGFSAASHPVRTRGGMVVSANQIASQIGADVLAEGGTAVDAAVATAFALAVTHPTAGNVGGGGFLLYRPVTGEPAAYDFREVAPSGSSPTMFLKNGKYDSDLHHNSHIAVGVPGTVAGLHLAWKEYGKLPWARLVTPAVALARDGFTVTDGLARSLRGVLPAMTNYPASVAQFSKNGVPYEMGETLRQPDLARTLERIAQHGPDGFYKGETAQLLAKEMAANGGLITEADLAAYQPKKRLPLRGAYRGYEILAMPPISSGGTALLEMLNILEGYDLKTMGWGSAAASHRVAEAMRRAYADRARYVGDPDFNPEMPIDRLVSKPYAAKRRASIEPRKASVSSPNSFTWPRESAETTHFSVVDTDRNAVSLTYTLEDAYGSKIVVPGAGFLLNNEMGDFNAGPGLTSAEGLVGTKPNLAEPGKRMLSSMTPTILTRDGKLFLVIGSPGGRTIINTVLHVILNVVDHGMNVQEAIDAPRFHHQWLPDRIAYEKHGLSPDTLELLRSWGHQTKEVAVQGVAEGIVLDATEDLLEGGFDRRAPDGGVALTGSTDAPGPPLVERIRRLAAETGAEVSVAARSLDGGFELLLDPDKPYHAASTMKVPVMIELFRQVEAGTSRLDDTLVVRNEFKSMIDGSPYALDPKDDSDAAMYAKVGQAVTLRDLGESMITVSGNLATNVLMEKLGVSNIRATVERLGANGMQVVRGLEDSKAFAAGKSNSTTARGFMDLLLALAQGRAVNPRQDAQMVEILTRQKFSTAIPAGLPAGTVVAHKTGWITKIHHDGGIVFGPRPFALVILTRGVEEDSRSASLMASIARVVYDAVGR